MIDKFSTKFGRIIELATWLVIILVLFGVRFLPQNPIDNTTSYYMIGGITALALCYYLIIYKYFSRTNRMYLKDMADIILIGVLIHLLKDYGQFFFALYFLPIVAAALSLEFMNALLLATIATIFVIFEIFLGTYNLLPQASPVLQGFWQIGLILFITIFCRFLARELKSQQSLKEASLARQKVLEEESVRQREFISLAAHQLYTPLSIIRGFSSLLNEKQLGKLTPKQNNATEEIYTNTKRMINLVSELLSVSKIESGKIQLALSEISINQILTELVKEFDQIKTNKNVNLVLKLSDNIKNVRADNDKIRQVCGNLIDNAIKYTQSGNITVSTRQNDTETVVSVRDQGSGIKDEDSGKIFQPFYRGQNILELDNRGTGLGLYISKLIVEKHGGRIWYDKEKDGTTFCFSIPEKKIIGGFE